MSRRLPAPPPPGAPPDPREPKDREPDPRDDDEPDGDWDDPSEHDDPLLDPTAWPDDLDEPTVPDGLLDADADLEHLPDLGIPEESDELADDDLVLEDLPLEDDLTDLSAPDDAELPILPWQLEVLIDGVPTPGRADPGADRTLWLSPGADATEERVTLRIADIDVVVVIQVQPADVVEIVLGRDVLAGRFLLRP